MGEPPGKEESLDEKHRSSHNSGRRAGVAAGAGAVRGHLVTARPEECRKANHLHWWHLLGQTQSGHEALSMPKVHEEKGALEAADSA
jgi:hypothetical protein